MSPARVKGINGYIRAFIRSCYNANLVLLELRHAKIAKIATLGHNICCLNQIYMQICVCPKFIPPWTWYKGKNWMFLSFTLFTRCKRHEKWLKQHFFLEWLNNRFSWNVEFWNKYVYAFAPYFARIKPFLIALQTVQTLIRGLLQEPSDLGLHCLQIMLCSTRILSG